MKIIKKISIAILATICIVMCTPIKSEAGLLEPIMNGGDAFISNAENREIFDSGNERSAIDQLYYLMLSIGVVLAVVVGIILGIQFITSGAAGQAKVKEKLIPFALGALIVFGAFGIWRLVYNVLNSTL